MKTFNYFKNQTSIKISYFLFALLLIFAQVYYFYRYIFQFGSSATSTYHDTPAIFESIKYIVFAAFYAITALLLLPYAKRLYQERVKPHLPFWILVAAFSVFIFIKTLLTGFHLSDFAVTQIVKMLFVIPVALLVPLLIAGKFPEKLFKYILAFSLAYNLIYEIIQIILFYAIRRPTNLNFGIIFPRYGGGWDDPNGFAAFAVLLIVIWIAFGYRKNKFVDLGVLTLLTLLNLFTYSVTAIVGLFVVTVILFILRALPTVKAAVIIGTTLAFALAHYLLGLIPILIKAKQFSSVGHLANAHPTTNSGGGGEGLLILKLLSPLIGNPGAPLFHENLYIQLYFNFGLVGLALFVLILASTVFAAVRGMLAHRRQQDIYHKFFLVAVVYLVAFAVMNTGIPNAQVFPINFFTWVIIGLVWALSAKVSWQEILGLDLWKKLTANFRQA